MRPGHQGDIRAADYVLGLMSPAEVRRFEQDLSYNPDLADEVEIWRARVARLKDEAEPTPQAEMRRRIADGFAQGFVASGALVAAQTKPAKQIGRAEIAILAVVFGTMLGATIVWLALG